TCNSGSVCACWRWAPAVICRCSGSWISRWSLPATAASPDPAVLPYASCCSVQLEQQLLSRDAVEPQQVPFTTDQHTGYQQGIGGQFGVADRISLRFRPAVGAGFEVAVDVALQGCFEPVALRLHQVQAQARVFVVEPPGTQVFGSAIVCQQAWFVAAAAGGDPAQDAITGRCVRYQVFT